MHTRITSEAPGVPVCWRDRDYTVEQLADVLSLPTGLIDEIICDQIGPPRCHSGDRSAYSTAEIIEWLMSIDISLLVDKARGRAASSDREFADAAPLPSSTQQLRPVSASRQTPG